MNAIWPLERAHDIDARWTERTTLADGQPVTLRMLRADDRDELARAFARLSPASRYMRFHSPRRALSDADLRYLTELDGERHVAIVATDAGGEGIGVARFIALDDASGVAEPALTVVDAFHRRGVGRLLMVRLTAAALERGVRCFRASVLDDNVAMRALLRGLATTVHERPDGDAVRFDVPLARSFA